MYITTLEQFKKEMTKKVLRPLLDHLSKKAIAVLKKEMDKATISTKTLQNYIFHSLNEAGTESIIYIEFDLMQEQEGKEPVYEGKKLIEWGRFTSLDNSTRYGDKPITWHMVDWLENGVTGGKHYIGNQPIKDIGMFENTRTILEQKIPAWTKGFIKKFNYKKK